jgi:hypothetical protein
MEHILKAYQRRLVNLSANNRALLLRRLQAGLQLDWHDLDFVLGKPAFELLRTVITGKKSLPVAPLADPRQAAAAPLSRKLQAIFRRSELLREEHGTPELYVGWPFVRGKFNEGSSVRCPLLFFPVNLQRGAKNWAVNPAGTPFFNSNFLLAYAHFNQLPPDENLLNFDLSGFPEDALEFRTALYELLKSSGLELNFNRDLFEDKTIPFAAFTKTDLDKISNPGELKLYPEAVLGIFPQAGSYLLADYDALLARTDLQNLADLFPSQTETFSRESKTFEQNTFAVFDLDAAQENILQEVKRGRSVVVQGPPGTGKSQLICNLVTDFTARGKTVWVVCQKRAALEVVQQRLAAKGFGNFTALVHDAEADRRQIFNQLRFQIEETKNYKKQNNRFSLVMAERQYLEISRRLNQVLQTLSDFKTALFNAEACGWTPKELYLKSNMQAPKLALPDSFKLFTAGTLPFFLPELARYLESAQLYEDPAFVLTERKSFTNQGWKELNHLQNLGQEIPQTFRDFLAALPAGIGKKYHAVAAAEELENQSPVFKELLSLITPEAVFKAFKVLFSLEAGVLKFFETEVPKLHKFFASNPPVYSTAQLEEAEEALQKYTFSRQSFFSKTAWQFQTQNKNVLQFFLQHYKLPYSETGIAALEKDLTFRREKLHKIRKLNAVLEPAGLQFSEDFSAAETQFDTLKNALAAVKMARKLVKQKWLDAVAETVPFQVEKLLQLQTDLNKKSQDWQPFLTEVQVQKLAEDAAFRQKFLMALPEHFEPIAAHDSRFAAFSEAEKTVAQSLQKLPGQAPEKLALFGNSLYLHWLYFLEEQFPVLKLAGPELDTLETELQELLQQKQALTHEIVAVRLRERTYAGLEKNRLGNVVSYRKLHAQVSKKRNLFSLRKLHQLFGEEIADLVPCWLASPETISALFPISQTVDLVIFDEASQAFAENGLPALARARQVVIAGDEHQLGPADLYRSRWQTEDEETEELIVESLLQLGNLHLPQYWLTEHYRSRFPELIAFSNAHFYRHKLNLIPDRQDLETALPAIRFLRTNGTWKNQANLEEAEKVTALLFQLLQEGHSDIGIITFNFAQQNLVQDLVEKFALENLVVVPASVQIKNIENMQGDEKQVVILSVGYAPDETGKMNVQFGSLSQAKGENRLNVAITRAISTLYVCCSFDPEGLKVAHTAHAGPKLLKEFLGYARYVSEGRFRWQTPETNEKTVAFYLKNRLPENAERVGELIQNLPFADLTLKQNGRYCHVVRTDDDLYFGQLSARQTHADVPFLLQKRNWPYTNFYSRQFWLNPEKARLQFRKLC